MKAFITALALGATVANLGAQTPGRAPVPRAAASAAKPTSVRISVKDRGGASLSDVRLLVSGAAGDGQEALAAAGAAVGQESR